jgi:hypothetical protein
MKRIRHTNLGRTAALAIGTLCGMFMRPGTALADTAQDCCAVVELRQYIVYPGQRDVLISLFDKEFIEPQESAGIRIVGQFRDANDPYRFTWVRGFAGMEARKQALGDFYGGAVWTAHRSQANATLYDNDDVLLLRQASPGSGFKSGARSRTAEGAGGGLVVANLYYFANEVPREFIARFDTELMPLFQRSGARVTGRFVSEKSKNTFERLPVRENVNVFAWFARFDDRRTYDDYLARLAQDARWRDRLFGELYKSLLRPPETLMLTPTARSLLR